jgi:hypothetical protein
MSKFSPKIFDLESTFKLYSKSTFPLYYKILKNWENIVGEKIAKVSMPAFINKTVLYVRVANSTWRMELDFFKKDLIGKINSILKGKFIDDVKFKTGELIKINEPQENKEKIASNEKYITKQEIEIDFNEIKDNEIKNQIKKTIGSFYERFKQKNID